MACLRYRVLRNNLIFLILTIELDLEVVIFRMNLIGQFGFLNYIPDKFEVIEEKKKLPEKPNDNKEKRTDAEAHHDVPEVKLFVGVWAYFVHKGQKSDL